MYGPVGHCIITSALTLSETENCYKVLSIEVT